MGRFRQIVVFLIVLLTACTGPGFNQTVVLDPDSLSVTASTDPTGFIHASATPLFAVETTPELPPTAPMTAPVPTGSARILQSPTLSPSTETAHPGRQAVPSEQAAPIKQAAEISIELPGDGSRVVSPLRVRARLNEPVFGSYRAELFGQDGRLLYRQVWSAPDDLADQIVLDLSIKFLLPSEEEKGRFVITRLDAQNRLQAVNSVELILNSTGNNDLKPVATTQAVIVILSPLEGEGASGGKIQVSGRTTIPKGESLRVQLVTEDGKVIGQRLAAVDETDGGVGFFMTEVPYRVESDTTVRLIVFGVGDPISPITHLSSLLVRVARSP